MSKHTQSRAAWLAAALAAAAAISLPARAQAPASPVTGNSTAAAAPSPADEKSYLQIYGWLIAQQAGVRPLGLTPAEIDQVAAGMKLALTADDIPGGRENAMKMQQYLSGRAEKIQIEQAAKQTAEAEKFFAELAKKPNVKKTASGLYYEIITPGTDPKPKPTELVLAKYKGTLLDGKVFDQTTGDETRDFTLDQVIKGWSEGLQLIGKGGKIKLYVPGNLGYGMDSPQSIPPNATLVFDVELVDIKPPPPPQARGLQGLPPELLQQLGGPPPGAR